MAFNDFIKVSYEVLSTSYSIKKGLEKLLEDYQVLSLDTECRSIYTKEERNEAKSYLENCSFNDKYFGQASVVVKSNGLSFPEITKVTHFVFGLSKEKSLVIVVNNAQTEILVWNTIAEAKNKFLIHNALFDLKIMYQRIGKLPENYLDTSLFAKVFINHAVTWKAKTSLKHLMADFYDPKWVLMDDYEKEDLKDSDFLMYAAIDGAATYHLWELEQEMAEDRKNV